MTNHPIEIGPHRLSLEKVYQISCGKCTPQLSDDPEWTKRISDNESFFRNYMEGGGQIYGVTTGFGNSCTVEVRNQLIKELPRQLTRFHGCGLGLPFSPEQTRAILVARLCSLTCARSGVRMLLLESLVRLLQFDILPLIPQEGSVGASGDLTPLSYVAAVLMGERDVWYHGEIVSAKIAFLDAGIKPIQLQPKESLALMNGTAAMTGVACLAWIRAEYLLQLSARITALSVVVLNGNQAHFAPELFAAKPHPGQADIAERIFKDLETSAPVEKHDHLQDRYSIRCAPHVLGVLADALPWMKTQTETELNSANDNPIVDHEAGKVLHGGHFYGGHIAFVMDSLKNAVANIADLLDRQIALMVDPVYNRGLPANLSGASAERQPINHGFKALQIASSAWTAEALKLTMPASVFSRSTECHNQDKVSMGTISARDAVRVLELVEQVASAGILVAVQGVWLRQKENDLRATHLSEGLQSFCDEIAEQFDFLDEDRPLDQTLVSLCESIRAQKWELK